MAYEAPITIKKAIEKYLTETKEETNERIENFIQNLDMNSNILIISHGFFMILLLKKLKKIGYRGDIQRRIGNGKVYILEK